MAQTQVVIVYSPGQGRRRTVIIPDDDSQIPTHTSNLLPGEAVLVGTLAQYHSIGPDAMLFAHVGHAPLTDRCIVVSPNAVNQTVLNVVNADPAIDSIAGLQLLIDVTGQAYPGLPVVNGVAVIPGTQPSSSSSSHSSSKSSSSRASSKSSASSRSSHS